MKYIHTNTYTGYESVLTFPQLVERFGFQYAEAIHRISCKHGIFTSQNQFTVTNTGHDEGFKPAIKYANELQS